MSEAKNGDTVSVHYTGRLEDGSEFDTSVGREPLEFTIGKGQLIPGFENAVIGLKPGESKTVTVPADQAYGERRDEMVIEVERDKLPSDLDPQVGERLQMQRGDQSFQVTVEAVTDQTVTLDANHPLAGKTLVFDIELQKVS